MEGVAGLFAAVRDSSRAPRLALLLTIAGGAALVLIASRGTWFYLDDWDFVARRGGFGWSDYFNPQNQNWYSTTVGVYQLLLRIFGFMSYVPFRLALAVFVAGIGLLTFVYARPRVGAWLAIVAAALVVFSPGHEILLWPFQMGQLISILAGLAALVVLDRPSSWRRHVGVATLLVVATASSSAGVPLVAIVAYDRLLRRGQRLQALVVAPAVFAYALWYEIYGKLDPSPAGRNIEAFNFALRRAIDVGDGGVLYLLGLGNNRAGGMLIAQLFLIGLLVAVCWRVFGAFTSGRERVVAVAAGLATYWWLLAWGRSFVAGIEFSPRYLFVTQVLLVLLLVEIGVGARQALSSDRRWTRPYWRAGSALAITAVVIVAANAVRENIRSELAFGSTLRTNATAMRGQVYALWLLDETARANATIFLEPLGPQIPRPAREYFAALDRYGDRAGGESDVLQLSATARAYADRTLLQRSAVVAADDGTLPSPAGSPPAIKATNGGATVWRSSRSCVRFSGNEVQLEPPIAGTTITNHGTQPLVLAARRYADDWSPQARITAPAGGSIYVKLTADRGTTRWQLRVIAKSARICTLPT